MLRSLRVRTSVAALSATLAVLLSVIRPAVADECSDAVLDYNAVLSRLNDAQEHYATCVADSRGMDDCARPFQRLESAQGQFAALGRALYQDVPVAPDPCPGHDRVPDVEAGR